MRLDFRRGMCARLSGLSGTVVLGGLFMLGGASLLRAVERAQVTPKPTESRTAVATGAAPRTREGSALVDMPGTFKLTGDRATFFPADGEQRFVGLENLNLERIALVVGENPDRLEWVVSGTVSEFRGANYLLITKAVLKNKPRARRAASLLRFPSAFMPRVS